MKYLKITVLLITICLGLPQSASALFTLTLTEDLSDVIASGSGSLDISGLTFGGTTSGNPRGMYPLNQTIRVGATSGGDIDFFSGFTSVPDAFGPGSFTLADSGTGDLVAVNNFYLRLFDGYVSGDSLSSTSVFESSTFATLGLTPGTYTWEWTSDSFVLQIGTVPEPSASAVCIGLSVFGISVFARRRRETKAS